MIDLVPLRVVYQVWLALPLSDNVPQIALIHQPESMHPAFLDAIA